MGAFARRPSWTWQLAGMIAALVVVLPIIALVLLAIFTFIVVFTIASAIAWVMNAFAPSTPRQFNDDAGRKNVRVVRHDQ